jgi:WD40 repeat protein
VQVYEVGEHQGRPFLALEYCGGGSLEGRLGGSPLPPAEAARLVQTLAHAVHAAHQANVVHRDLKPANVLLGADGTPKITDFGLAKKLDEQGRTQTGAIMGTPSYMAPEQAEGRKDVGPAADVHALGAILYECLTGRPPFRGPTPLDTVVQVVTSDPVAPTQLQPKVPRDLETICLKCLHKERARRYPRAEELAADLRRFLANEPIVARPVRSLERLAKWARRRPAAAALAVVSLLAALVVLGGGLWFTARLSAEKTRAVQAEKDAGDRADELQEQRDAGRHMLYFAHMKLAEEHLGDGEIGLLQPLLQTDRPGPSQEDLRGWEWYYLLGRCRGLTALTGHAGTVRAVAWSPDNRRLASAGDDGVVCIQDVSGGAPLTLHGHEGEVWSVAWAPGGRRLASAGEDGSVRVWNADCGEALQACRGHRGTVRSACWSPDGGRLASGGADGTVRLWDADTGKELAVLRGHKATVRTVAWSPDGKRLASGGGRERGMRPGEAHVWDVAGQRVVLSLVGHTGEVEAMAWSPDGGRLASAGGYWDDMVKVWGASSGKELLTLPRAAAGRKMPDYATGHDHSGHKQTVYTVAWSPDGSALVSAGHDRSVILWDARTGQQRDVWRRVGERAAWSPDGQRLASAGQNGAVRIWSTPSPGDCPTLMPSPTGRATGLAWSPDGTRLAATFGDKALRTVLLWSTATWQAAEPAPPQRLGLVPCLDWSPDGRRLAGAVQYANAVHVWDAATGRLEQTIPNLPSLYRLAWSPDGRRLAAGVRGEVKVWASDSWKEVRKFPGSGSAVVWSPDGRFLACRPADLPDRGAHRVAIWDVEAGSKVRELVGHTSLVLAIAWSPDGRSLATGGEDSTVRIWDASTGRQTMTQVGHSETVFFVAWSPDGRRVASAGADKVIKLWDVARGKELLALRGHSNIVYSVAWSPDGRRLASASYDGSVRIWDAVAGYRNEER